MATYLFDGIALATIPGVTLAPGTQLQSAVPQRLAEVEVAGVDGVTIGATPPVYGPRQIRVTVNVTGNTAAEVQTALAAVNGLLTTTRTLTRVHGTQSLTAPVRLQELTEETADIVDRYVKIAATYLLPTTFFEAPDSSAVPSVPDTAAPTVFTRTIPGAAAPQPGFKLLVAAPATYIKVTDANTGEWWEWTGAHTSGYLSADTQAGTASTGGVDQRGKVRTSPYGGRIHPTREGTVNLTITRRGGTGTFIIYLKPRHF